MTPEKQRVAIAEACGWRIGSEEFQLTTGAVTGYRWEHKNYHQHGGGLYGWGYNSKSYDNDLPDYPNDLNAMNEAEKAIIYVENETPEQEGQRIRYEVLLCDAVEHPLFATAGQRAEAFLKTIGKWT